MFMHDFHAWTFHEFMQDSIFFLIQTLWRQELFVMPKHVTVDFFDRKLLRHSKWFFCPEMWIYSES